MEKSHITENEFAELVHEMAHHFGANSAAARFVERWREEERKHHLEAEETAKKAKE